MRWRFNGPEFGGFTLLGWLAIAGLAVSIIVIAAVLLL